VYAARVKTALRWLLTVGMIIAGILHFVRPDAYAAIVPDWLPVPVMLVYISGVFEILGGLGLILPATRRLAAWGLIALFVAVFPANIHMAVHAISPLGGEPLPGWALWGRLPLQLVLIWWAYVYARREPG
jgi:uncharacterized membrane protein